MKRERQSGLSPEFRTGILAFAPTIAAIAIAAVAELRYGLFLSPLALALPLYGLAGTVQSLILIRQNRSSTYFDRPLHVANCLAALLAIVLTTAASIDLAHQLRFPKHLGAPSTPTIVLLCLWAVASLAAAFRRWIVATTRQPEPRGITTRMPSSPQRGGETLHNSPPLAPRAGLVRSPPRWDWAAGK